MSERTVSIVGSGIVGSIIAYLLTKKGITVNVFEKGPDYPYPHRPQFRERIRYLYFNPKYETPADLKNLTLSGNYPRNPDAERFMRLGGSATRWEAITLRMHPNDFKTKTIYGFGDDWPISYDDLEPYYCKAEELLGVSGTDADNPFAPWRSKPYPLPPFELSYDDVILAERLKNHGIVLHTTPQARTRNHYEKRPACVNYGICRVCPIGARYSPNYHLLQAMETGLCKIHINTSVRKIIIDETGHARALIYHPDNTPTAKEHSSKVFIVAAGAIESARFLLLSRNNHHSDGLGNNGGHVGKNLMFHHVWQGFIRYKDCLFPGRFGGRTGECHQFLEPPKRGFHGGIKVQFTSTHGEYIGNIVEKSKRGSDIIRAMQKFRYQRSISFHAETLAIPQRYLTLSEKRDRFGDPYAHVHYESTDFDHESYRFARKIFDSFVEATEGKETEFPDFNHYDSGAHHMGTARMGRDIRDSVVNEFGKVHETKNLFVIGGSSFVSSGTVNPTLTIVALAIRTAEYIMDQLL